MSHLSEKMMDNARSDPLFVAARRALSDVEIAVSALSDHIDAAYRAHELSGAAFEIDDALVAAANEAGKKSAQAAREYIGSLGREPKQTEFGQAVYATLDGR